MKGRVSGFAEPLDGISMANKIILLQTLELSRCNFLHLEEQVIQILNRKELVVSVNARTAQC